MTVTSVTMTNGDDDINNINNNNISVTTITMTTITITTITKQVPKT